MPSACALRRNGPKGSGASPIATRGFGKLASRSTLEAAHGLFIDGCPPICYVQSSRVGVCSAGLCTTAGFDPALVARRKEDGVLPKMIAKKIFLTKGVGKHRERLTSFELALRDAGIAHCNLVRVSSIFPPRCKMITRVQGQKALRPGEVVFAVLSENSTREPHRLIAASIGLAQPADREMYGYLSEHHSFGETEQQAGEYAEELAAEMLATTLNVDFDPEKSWDEKKEIYRISDKIVRTLNISQSAVGDKRGLWTTVLAAAILLPE